MSFRRRLILWIGCLFAVTSVLSFFLEEYLTKRYVTEAEQKLDGEIKRLSAEMAGHINRFLKDELATTQAKIGALIERIAHYPFLRQGFAPPISDKAHSAWFNASSLLLTNPWVDFIQTTYDGQATATVALSERHLQDAFLIKEVDDFQIVAVREPTRHGDQWVGPYFGIKMKLGFALDPEKAEVTDDRIPPISDFVAFFTKEQLLSMKVPEVPSITVDISLNFLEPFIKWVKLEGGDAFLNNFIEQLTKLMKLVENDQSLVPDEQVWQAELHRLLAAKPDGFLDHRPYKILDKLLPDMEGDGVEGYFDSKLLHDLDRYYEVGMVWGLTIFSDAQLFGTDPLDPAMPKGMAQMKIGSRFGQALLSNHVFYDHPLYIPDACASELTVDAGTGTVNVQVADTTCSPNKLEAIVPKGEGRVFFGNTLNLVRKTNGVTKHGALTVGVLGDDVISRLARATALNALFIADGEIVSAYDGAGASIADTPEGKAWFRLPVHDLTSKPYGLIEVDGISYFFLHVVPFESMDFHFFIFNPAAKEFAFLNFLRDAMTHAMHKSSIGMGLASLLAIIIVLIVLSNITRRATKPLEHLASLTKTVADGKYEEIIKPELTEGRQDEISTLYHSFFEMVQGLKEKERVRGILNKVVSAEIAEETLKGNVHLGGEEMRVTVLFADIRHFTQMTEKMPPHEVITLINTCMTKISHIIDEYGGVIDKYVGDEVMALFGAPVSKVDSAFRAVKSAVDMLSAVKEWNEERAQSGLPTIDLGIGIHTGLVVAGNMGADNRLNYTVLGSNVNLASRLCSNAKGMQILISEDTFKESHVTAHVDAKKLEPIEVKGFSDPVEVYEVEGYKDES